MIGENKKLKQFLLGTLPESENEELDLRIISDESFAEELSLAEHELIEDHLEGSLSGDETARFESNFLVSPERRAMLREISLLKEFAKKQIASLEQETLVAKPSSRSGSFFSFYFRPLLAGAAILIAVLAIGIVWNEFRETGSPLEREYAEINKRDLSDLAQLTNYYPINLSSATFRDTASAPKQSADKLTETVLFRLALPVNTADNSLFQAKIRRAGTPDFTIDEVRSYRNPNGYEARLLVPKAILQKGQYQVIVESKFDAAAVAIYAFAVE